MSKFPNYLVKAVPAASLIVALGVPAFADGHTHGLGREALPEEIAAWDLDIAPDGRNLPVGSGSVEDGEMIFSDNCAVCHGEFAEGAGNWPKLAGGDDSLADVDPLKTVGSYWPYLSTVYDYVRRSMPFGAAQTMTDDDTYAITAYILYSNYLVEDDFVLSNENFMDVEMPNAGGFIVDDRAETEYNLFTSEAACYENCKETVEITKRAAVLDVTPEDEGAAEAAAEPAPAEGKTAMAEAAEPAQAEAEPAQEAPEMAAAFDAELAAAGEKVFKKCKACHQVGEGAKNKTGPVLNGIYGAAVGAVDGYKYSKDLVAAGAEGMVWDDANMAQFFTKPKAMFKKTKMSFAGLKKEKDVAAVIEYLKSVSP